MEMNKARTLNNRNLIQYTLNLLLAVFVLLTILGTLKTIFFSSDIDEAYAVTQAYRLLNGDKLLLDMWEPHQFSAYLPAIFMKLFLAITNSTEYIVIYLRVIGTLIHLALGVWLYRSAHRLVGTVEGLFLTLLHVNFLAKWVQLPEFELMNYWYLLITLLCLHTYYDVPGKDGSAPKNRYLLLAGSMMLLQVCNYPTMLLLYPCYILGIVKMQRSTGKEILITTLAAIIPGLGFLGYLFSYLDLETFQASLSYLLSDPSHTERSFWMRMSEFGVTTLQDLGNALFSFGIFYLLAYFPLKKRGKSIKEIVLAAFLLDILAYCAATGLGCLFGDENQFYLQSRYLLICGLGIFLYHACATKKSTLYWFGIVPGFFAMLGALMVSNMTMNEMYSKLYVGVLCSFLLLFSYHHEHAGEDKFLPVLSYLTCMAVLLCLVICRLVLIRVTGCLPVTMNAAFAKVTSGPLKGIYMVERTAETLSKNAETLQNYVTKEDKLLYFGCENTLYLCTDAAISAASVQGTSVFNEDFLEYFEVHPEKYPTVIAVDKNFTTDYYMVYNPYNYIVADWIEQEYEYVEKVETENMILYFSGK